MSQEASAAKWRVEAASRIIKVRELFPDFYRWCCEDSQKTLIMKETAARQLATEKIDELCGLLQKVVDDVTRISLKQYDYSDDLTNFLQEILKKQELAKECKANLERHKKNPYLAEIDSLLYFVSDQARFCFERKIITEQQFLWFIEEKESFLRLFKEETITKHVQARIDFVQNDLNVFNQNIENFLLNGWENFLNDGANEISRLIDAIKREAEIFEGASGGESTAEFIHNFKKNVSWHEEKVEKLLSEAKNKLNAYKEVLDNIKLILAEQETNKFLFKNEGKAKKVKERLESVENFFQSKDSVLAVISGERSKSIAAQKAIIDALEKKILEKEEEKKGRIEISDIKNEVEDAIFNKTSIDLSILQESSWNKTEEENRTDTLKIQELFPDFYHGFTKIEDNIGIKGLELLYLELAKTKESNNQLQGMIESLKNIQQEIYNLKSINSPNLEQILTIKKQQALAKNFRNSLEKHEKHPLVTQTDLLFSFLYAEINNRFFQDKKTDKIQDKLEREKICRAIQLIKAKVKEKIIENQVKPSFQLIRENLKSINSAVEEFLLKGCTSYLDSLSQVVLKSIPFLKTKITRFKSAQEIASDFLKNFTVKNCRIDVPYAPLNNHKKNILNSGEDCDKFLNNAKIQLIDYKDALENIWLILEILHFQENTYSIENPTGVGELKVKMIEHKETFQSIRSTLAALNEEFKKNTNSELAIVEKIDSIFKNFRDHGAMGLIGLEKTTKESIVKELEDGVEKQIKNFNTVLDQLVLEAKNSNENLSEDTDWKQDFFFFLPGDILDEQDKVFSKRIDAMNDCFYKQVKSFSIQNLDSFESGERMLRRCESLCEQYVKNIVSMLLAYFDKTIQEDAKAFRRQHHRAVVAFVSDGLQYINSFSGSEKQNDKKIDSGMEVSKKSAAFKEEWLIKILVLFLNVSPNEKILKKLFTKVVLENKKIVLSLKCEIEKVVKEKLEKKQNLIPGKERKKETHQKKSKNNGLIVGLKSRYIDKINLELQALYGSKSHDVDSELDIQRNIKCHLIKELELFVETIKNEPLAGCSGIEPPKFKEYLSRLLNKWDMIGSSPIIRFFSGEDKLCSSLNQVKIDFSKIKNNFPNDSGDLVVDKSAKDHFKVLCDKRLTEFHRALLEHFSELLDKFCLDIFVKNKEMIASFLKLFGEDLDCIQQEDIDKKFKDESSRRLKEIVENSLSLMMPAKEFLKRVVEENNQILLAVEQLPLKKPAEEKPNTVIPVQKIENTLEYKNIEKDAENEKPAELSQDSFKLPDPILKILRLFTSQGYNAFIVGGFVRDLLTNKKYADVDIITDMPVDTLLLNFKNVYKPPYISGLYQVIIDKVKVDISFRETKVFTPGSDKFLEDAKARAFTVNALYCDEKQIYDPLGSGIKDLTDKVLCLVGDGNTSFLKDPSLYFRAIRLCTKYKLTVSKGLEANMRFYSSSLNKYAPEHRLHELKRLFLRGLAVENLKKIKDLGLLRAIFPDRYTQEFILSESGKQYYDWLQFRLSEIDVGVNKGFPVFINQIYVMLLTADVLADFNQQPMQEHHWVIYKAFLKTFPMLLNSADYIEITNGVSYFLNEIFELNQPAIMSIPTAADLPPIILNQFSNYTQIPPAPTTSAPILVKCPEKNWIA